MRYTGRTSGYLSSEYFPAGVKWLLIVNTALFVLYFSPRARNWEGYSTRSG